MNTSLNINYLTHSQIDKIKWDSCIQSSGNGLIYAFSFYLDIMSKNWDALVLNDYDAVFPLPWNKKFGIYYNYQPFLTAQLGIFSKSISNEIVNSFIQAIPAKFKYIDLSLNNKNIEGCPAGFTTCRNNFILDLNCSYAFLYSKYSENIQRNIKKAKQQGCIIEKDIDVEKIISLASLQMKKNNHQSKENIRRFRKVYNYLQKRNMTSTYAVLSSEKKILASCVFFLSNKRAYYILVGNHPEGKSTGASHALIDAFIKENASKELLLDFEGSDITSLAQFYKGFGAKNETYPAVKINRLPFYIKWLKSN